MDDLIKKLEAAEAGSRELDAEIYALLYEGWEPGGVFEGHCREVGNPGQFVECPHYTASLDAALTLVPEGWALVDLGENGVWGINGKAVPWLAVTHRRGIRETNDDKEGWAATPALALCIAAIKARDDVSQG